MSKPIRVGDLACVVRACCRVSEANNVGRIAVALWVAPRRTLCGACGMENMGIHAGSAHGRTGVPVGWLRRIDPPGPVMRPAAREDLRAGGEVKA